MRSDARSEPALGSLIPNDAVISARKIGTAQRLLLLVTAERNQRRRNNIHTLGIEAVVDPPPAELLQIDILLQTVALRPPNSGG